MKYFVNLEKAFEQDGKFVVQGLASGTLEDRDDQRVNFKVLQKFADYINKKGLPLTNGHQKGGAVDDDLGTLTFANIVEQTDGIFGLFIKGELDMDNPSNQYMVKKINQGKKFAFSIEGINAVKQPVWSERLKKNILEFVDAIPQAITITTKPSYIPSFLEVLEKSYKENGNENVLVNLNNDNSYKTQMSEQKIEETVESTEEIKPVEASETSKPEVSAEESVVEETKEETVDAKSEEEAQEVASEESVEEEIEKSYESRRLSKSSQDEDPMSALMTLVKSIDKRLEQIEGLRDGKDDVIEKSNETIITKLEGFDNVLKSFHSDIEALKNMPLQKQSKVIRKSYDELVAEKPKDLKSALASTI